MKFPSTGQVSRTLPFAFLALASPLYGEVLTVGKELSHDFAQIQPAVDAAGEGDTIVVYDSEAGPSPWWAYDPFTIDGKSLTVVAAQEAVLVSALFGAAPSEPSLYVRNLASDQTVVVRGLEFELGLSVEDCAGGVWFDEVRVYGSVYAPIFCNSGDTHGAHVVNSSKVTFTHCRLQGENVNGSIDPFVAGVGLVAESSNVHVFDSLLAGGWGQSGGGVYWAVLEGGAGLRLEDSTATISGSVLRGGPGGLLQDPSQSVCDLTHAPGGPGAELVGPGSKLMRTDSTITGGVADLDSFCPGMTGPAGPDLVGASQVQDMGGKAHHLTANGPVPVGERVNVTLEGVPGEFAVVAFSPDYNPAPWPLPGGVLLPGVTEFYVLDAGVLDAAGFSTLSVLVPPLAGGLESLLFFAQGIFVDANSSRALAGGAAIVLLDTL